MHHPRDWAHSRESRDAEFSLDNTLFRFGWRDDIAVVETNQVLKFTAAA